MHIKDKTSARIFKNGAVQVGYVLHEAPGRSPYNKDGDIIHREVFYKVYDDIWIDLYVPFIYEKLLNETN